MFIWHSSFGGRTMKLWTAALLALLVGPAAALPHYHEPGQAPYAGWQHRDIKALRDQELADLRADHGMRHPQTRMRQRTSANICD
jgi:hypothetical protein